MNERKNIDRLFQEKFKDFEASPPADSWANIESRLNKEEKKRRIIPFWFQLSGVAAALILGWFIFQNSINDSTPINSVVNQEKSDGDNSIEQLKPNSQQNNINSDVNSDNSTQIVAIPNALDEGRSGNTSSYKGNEKSSTGINQGIVLGTNSSDGNQNKIGTKDRMQKNPLATSKGVIKLGNNNILNVRTTDQGALITTSSNKETEKMTVNSDAFAQNKIITDGLEKNKIDLDASLNSQKIDSAAIATVEPNALEELLNEKENKVTAEEQKINRWQISSNVAPIYFSSTTDASPIDPQFSDNKKNYKQNLTFGMGVRYALNKKFTIRAGVNTLGMEYSTNDLVFYQSSSARSLAHVDLNVQGSVLQIESKSAIRQIEITPNNNILQKFDASINQKTGYFEVPVELSYKILDKKFGVELIGGMSTLFLTENQISMTSSGTTMEIGKANNLNSTHFSTNFGVGMKYNFLKSFQISVEPIVKYQINAFTDSGNYQPLYFGIYSGINYRF